jgi:hypothetical protein
VSDLSLWANLAAILTAVIAVFGYGKYQWDACTRRKKLEIYLKSEKEKGKDQGQRSALHLMARLGLTEAEILHASFSSKYILRKIATDQKTNRAEALLFEYSEQKEQMK